jgi:hypothetical protein
MHWAAGEGGIRTRCADVVLIGQLGLNQRGLCVVQKGQHNRHGVVPPWQTAQIGLLAREVTSCQMHAGQHAAHSSAVHFGGGKLALAAQAVDHRGGFAFDG